MPTLSTRSPSMCLACKSRLQAAGEDVFDQVGKGVSVLSARGDEGGHHFPCAGSPCGAVSAGELAVDDHRAQLSFGQVVGSRDRLVPQEGEEVILLLEQPLPNGLLIGLSPGLAQQAFCPLVQAQGGICEWSWGGGCP